MISDAITAAAFRRGGTVTDSSPMASAAAARRSSRLVPGYWASNFSTSAFSRRPRSCARAEAGRWGGTIGTKAI